MEQTSSSAVCEISSSDCAAAVVDDYHRRPHEDEPRLFPSDLPGYHQESSLSTTSLPPLVAPEGLHYDSFPLRGAPSSSSGYTRGCFLPQTLPFSSFSYGPTTYTSSLNGHYYPGAATTKLTSLSSLSSSSYSYPDSYSLPGAHPHFPDPIIHSTTIASSSSLLGRKRYRDDVDDPDSSILPVTKTLRHDISQPSSTTILELPTPPDSSSDHSGTVSPQSYYQPKSVVPVTSLPTTFPTPPPPKNGVHVTLSPKTEGLWNLFYPLQTEMIVTKNGRCLFPLLVFNVSGLARKKEYDISIRAVSSDSWRYKYLHSSWTQVAETEYSHEAKRMTAIHPNSPQTGAKWMSKDVDFKSAKITHFAKSKGGDILLHTMHKYFFEVVIEERGQKDHRSPLVFPFHLTNFIAVTAYQSAKLTELKKEKNPFARGVRHHESETDVRPSAPYQPEYQYPSASYPSNYGYMVGYGSTTSSSPSVSVPYPTPWNQNGHH